MQISVAHARERPADFRQNAQRPKGVPLGLLFGPLCCPPGVHIPNGLLSRTALDTGMGFVRDEPTQRPYLRGHASVTLYLTPSLWKTNSRSALRISNCSTPNSRKPSIIAEQISSFSGLGFLSRLTSVFLRSACRAFFAPACSSGSSSYNFSPLSIRLSSSISSMASSRLIPRDFINFAIFSSIGFIPFLYHHYSTVSRICQEVFVDLVGEIALPLWLTRQG